MTPEYTLEKPKDFEKVPLPGLTAWVKALRSGEYQQGTGWLCDGSRYCCLGVLSAVQGRLVENRKQGYESWGEGVLAEDNPLFGSLNYEGLLPEGCLVSKGIKTFVSLVNLNDHMNLPFAQIADILEELYIEPS